MLGRPLVFVLALNLPNAAQEPTFEAARSLPLAVGNSWTFGHLVIDEKLERLGSPDLWTAYDPYSPPDEHTVTISILRSEIIDQETYYVFSEMPDNWPPAPPHFLAGRRVRWEGNDLMQRDSTGELSIFRFSQKSGSYSIPSTEEDTEVRLTVWLSPLSSTFSLSGHDHGLSADDGFPTSLIVHPRWVKFVDGHGMTEASEQLWIGDNQLFENTLKLVGATINGTTLLYGDALLRSITSSSTSSWGEMKDQAVRDRQ